MERDKIPPEIIEKAEKRKAAKLNKDWTLADAIRDEITEAGFVIEDTPDSYRLKHKYIGPSEKTLAIVEEMRRKEREFFGEAD